MAMGKRKRQRQGSLWVEAGRLARGPGHPFYRRLNQLLTKHGFDATTVDASTVRLGPSEAAKAHPAQGLACALSRPYQQQGRRVVRDGVQARPGRGGGQAEAEPLPQARREATVGEGEEPGLLAGDGAQRAIREATGLTAGTAETPTLVRQLHRTEHHSPAEGARSFNKTVHADSFVCCRLLH